MLSDSTLHNTRTKAPTAMPTVRPVTSKPVTATTATVRTAKQVTTKSSGNASGTYIAIYLLLFFAIIIIVLVVAEKSNKKKRLSGKETDEMNLYKAFNDCSFVSRFRCSPLINVTPYDYECVIANFLRKGGYRDAKATAKSGDYGADIVGTGLNGEKMCAQCKMYNKPVGLKPIQEIVAAKAVYGCKSAIVISTSDYTDNAIKLARMNGVKLVVYSDRIL